MLRKGDALIAETFSEGNSRLHRFDPRVKLCLALIYAGLDERDRAIEWLQTAVDKQVSELIYMKVDPYLDKLRPDPRFAELLRQVKLER